MRHLGFLATLTAAALLAPLNTTPAAADDVYVNNTGGDDRLDGSAPHSRQDGSGPVRTLRRALQVAKKGDHIKVANTGVPYHESVSLSTGNNSGLGVKPLVIEGNGATLDGSRPVPREAWETYRGDVFRFQPERLHYQQLFHNGRPLLRRSVDSLDAALPELEPLQWCLYQGSIYFRTEWEKLPADYNLSYSVLPVGITLYHVHDVIILDLVVQGYQLDGVNASDGVLDCRLGGLTCRGNGRSGLAVCGSSKVSLDGCLLGDNGAAQLYTEGWSVTRIETSQLLDNTAPAIQRRGGRVLIDAAEAQPAP